MASFTFLFAKTQDRRGEVSFSRRNDSLCSPHPHHCHPQKSVMCFILTDQIYLGFFQRQERRVHVRAGSHQAREDVAAFAHLRCTADRAGHGLPARQGYRHEETQLQEHLSRAQSEAVPHGLQHDRKQV